MGLSCAAVQSGMTIPQYQAAFGADVTYVTGQELCFTYLRDNTATSATELVRAVRGDPGLLAPVCVGLRAGGCCAGNAGLRLRYKSSVV